MAVDRRMTTFIIRMDEIGAMSVGSSTPRKWERLNV
jgi:hypothetical protein